MPSRFRTACLLAILIILPHLAASAATGDVQFGRIGNSGALTSTLVPIGTPPAVFGTAADGTLKSFSLGTGLSISGNTINASGGSWGDLAGVPANLSALGSVEDAPGFLFNAGDNTFSWQSVIPLSAGGLGADLSAQSGIPQLAAGTVTYLGVSQGGGITADGGKLLQYHSDGSIYGAYYIAYNGTAGVASQLQADYVQWLNNGHTLRLAAPASIPADVQIRLPAVSVNTTLVSTADSGTVSNAMLAGSIATSKLSVSSDVKAVLDAANSAAIRSALSLVPGPGGNVQTQNAGLQTLADGFGAVFSGSGYVRWNGTTYELASSVLSSTWGGTGNSIYTVGDMLYANGSGTLSKLAGNTTTAKKFLSSSGNGSANTTTAWATPNLATDITGTLPVANGGTGITSLGTGVATALGNAVNAASGLLTYDMIGTSGAKIPLLNAANTFSDDISLAAGKRINLGGAYLACDTYSQVFAQGNWYYGYYTPQGIDNIYCNGSRLAFSALYTAIGNGVTMGVTDAYALDFYGTTSTHATAARFFNTRSSSTNWEAAVIDWITTTNTLRIGSDVGSGGGTARDVQIIRGGTTRVTIKGNTINISNIPTSSTGLSSGDVWSNGGVLTIVP